MNLVVNARDAMASPGTVTIRTGRAQVAASEAGGPDDMTPGEFVILTVADTGAGMSEDVSRHVFDTFFTTKGNRGSGLGLATVRDIVGTAGGHIEVVSQPGHGTSICIYWPVEVA